MIDVDTSDHGPAVPENSRGRDPRGQHNSTCQRFQTTFTCVIVTGIEDTNQSGTMAGEAPEKTVSISRLAGRGRERQGAAWPSP
jgi:hypothetical protein